MKFQLLFVIMGLAVSVARADAGCPDALSRPMPAAWTYAAEFDQVSPSDDAWWRGFDDVVLDSLISLGERANFDVAMAARRMEAARQQMRVARAAYFPQIGLQGGYDRTRRSGVTANTYTAEATASWQIDLFGKITASVRQSKAQYRASHAEYLGAMVSLAGEIASNYVQLRVWQAELAVAREHIVRQDTIAGIANTRFECGLASKIDVDQARTILYSTRATVPSLETPVHTAVSALALLTGLYPSEIEPLLASSDKFPDYRQLVGAGVPSELLRRRPDIVAAEYNLAAAAAAVGIAKKDFLPTLTLNGSVGVVSDGHGKFFSGDNLAYSIAPTLSWTLFDGMARSARVAAARADMEALVEQYNYTVMNAYNEVDNAMNSYLNAMRQINEYERAAEASDEFLRLSLELYTQGLSDFTNVANAQVDLLQYTNSLIVARGQAMSALVTLYEALGGGF
ncbi:MAG: efflux transporter outer membrane subunit [Bacteroidales bacterium]|nr:efflux transporter outer membrane subunit [Bacteroidales bacterium]